MANQIAYNIDCEEYMKTLPDNYFDWSNCDVQWGIGEGASKNTKRGGRVLQSNGSRIEVKAQDFGDDEWDGAPPSQSYFNEIFRVSKYVTLWGSNNYQFDQKESASGVFVWDKWIRRERGNSDGEIAWTNLFKGVRIITYLWNGMMQGRSIKEGTIQKGDKSQNEIRIQDCHKPVVLYEEMLRRFAKPGWKIFDSHLGSGSHMIAAHNLGFDFVGCEISKNRYDRSQRRYRDEINGIKHNPNINTDRIGIPLKLFQ